MMTLSQWCYKYEDRYCELSEKQYNGTLLTPREDRELCVILKRLDMAMGLVPKVDSATSLALRHAKKFLAKIRK